MDGRSLDGRGKASDVLELLNDCRRLVRLNILRTPVLLMPCGEEVYSGEEGDVGSIVLFRTVSASSSTSDSGYAPGIFRSGVVGCEFSGPAPVGGGATTAGGGGGCCLTGDSGGGGMSVPSVSEYLTGVTVRNKGLSRVVVFNVLDLLDMAPASPHRFVTRACRCSVIV